MTSAALLENHTARIELAGVLCAIKVFAQENKESTQESLCRPRQPLCIMSLIQRLAHLRTRLQDHYTEWISITFTNFDKYIVVFQCILPFGGQVAALRN